MSTAGPQGLTYVSITDVLGPTQVSDGCWGMLGNSGLEYDSNEWPRQNKESDESRSILSLSPSGWCCYASLVRLYSRISSTRAAVPAVVALLYSVEGDVHIDSRLLHQEEHIALREM